MTEREFCSLKYGTVISKRFDIEKYYVIESVDVFGNGRMDKESMTFGATELEGHHQVIISKSNAKFWEING